MKLEYSRSIRWPRFSWPPFEAELMPWHQCAGRLCSGRFWGTDFFRVLLCLFISMFILFSGCRSGQRIQDADYTPYLSVARTCWQPRPMELTPELTDSMVSSLATYQHQQMWSDTTGDNADPVSDELIVPDDLDNDASGPTHSFTLHEVMEIALSENPEIDIARKELDQANSRIPQVYSLADPMVDIGGWPIYPNVPQTADGRIRTEIMVSQQIPWHGKRQSRVGEASREVDAAENRFAAVELRVIAEVKQAYFDLGGAERTLEIVTQDVQLLRQLSEIVEALYETGRVGQQDVLQLNSEIGQAETEVSRARASGVRARAELIRVLHLPPNFPLAVSQDLPDTVNLIDLNSLYDQAGIARPELREALAKVQRDQWRVEQARLEYYPDLTFQFSWGEMTTHRALAPSADGIDTLRTGVNFNLPIRQGRLNAAVREAESRVVAGMFNLDRLRDETYRDISQLHAEIISQQEQLQTYKDVILPQIEQALSLILRAYQVDEADFLDVINIRRELLRLRLSELQVQIDLQKSWASLERLLAWIPQ